MPTRALGALLAAAAAVLFVVSIVTAAWWDGHPRVSGHVMTAKDVHIGLLGGSGCNTGGTGECQPVELGATFTAAAYGELGVVGLATAFAILVMGAAWRISDGRKRLAKLALIVSALAAAGAVVLLVIGPQIKSSVPVEVPIGWGMLVFGGGIAASLVGSLATMRVEREPLRLKTYAKAPPEPAFDVREMLREQHDGLRPSAPMLGPGASGSLPGPAGPLGAPLVPGAPQLRPLYDHQGAVPAPAAPMIPQRAPTPLPRASAHALAGLPTPPPELDPRAQSPSAFIETAERRLQSPSAFVETAERRLESPFARPPSPFEATADLSRSKPATAPPPPPPFVPAAAPYSKPPERPKPPTAPPPPFAGRPRPPSVAPFANPAVEPSVRIKSPSTAPPSRPSVDASVDPLGKTVPAPGKPRPSVPLPAKKPPPKPAPLPTPTPSLITSAAKPEPAGRSSQPTLAHAVPPMPQIDTPPPQLRAPTDADDRLETALRETEMVTAVEIDHEAKARYEEDRRQREGRAETATGVSEPPEAEATGISEPPVPRTTAEEPAAHVGDDTDAALVDRVDADPGDPVAPPPAKPAEPVKPPLSTAPASLPPPKTATLPVSGPTPACPQCESPMAWVEEHLRFYCKSCRMYF